MERVVTPLAVDPADGVHGWQVDHVEAHGRDVGKPPLGPLQGGRLTCTTALRAREHLVPGPKARTLAVDHERQLVVEARRPAAVRVAPYGLEQPLVREDARRRALAAGAAAPYLRRTHQS